MGFSPQSNGAIKGGNAITQPSKLELKDMEDLIHMSGPLTEDAVMKTLHFRFDEKKHFVSIANNLIIGEERRAFKLR